MAEKSRARWGLVVVILVAAVAVAVAVGLTFGRAGGPDGESAGVGEEGGSRAAGKAAKGYRPRRFPVRPIPEGADAAPSTPVVLGYDNNPPVRRVAGPRRFVARWGRSKRRPGAEERTREEARRVAEDVRRRALEGEDPSNLIRTLSDPPIGLEPELVRRHYSLGPDEASPVIEVGDGFAVFFGAPEEEAPSE